MAADVISSIKLDGSGDFTTINAWEAVNNVDLVADDTRRIAEIYDAETVATYPTVDYKGGVHNETNGNYLFIRAASGNEFSPKSRLGGKLVSNLVTDLTHGFVVRAGQVLHVENLGVSTSGNNNLIFNGGGITRFEKCTLYECKSGACGNNLRLVNCQIEPSFPGVSIKGSGGTIANASLDNCTIVQKLGFGSYSGDIAAHSCALMNTAAFNENTKISFNTFFACTGDFNAQNNNGSANAPGLNSLQNLLTTDFTDFSSNDYSIVSGSILEDSGADFSSLYTTDILGNPRVLPFSIGAFGKFIASGVTLVIDSILHAQSLDNVALLQQNSISVNSIEHAKLSGNLVLNQSNTLSINILLHGKSSDNLNLTESNNLFIDKIVHQNNFDNLILDPGNTLIINDITHTKASDNVDLVQEISLIINDILHSLLIDNIDLTQSIVLTVNSILHIKSVDNVALDMSVIISIDGNTHSINFDNLMLAQANTILVNAILHSKSADEIQLTQDSALIVHNILHSVIADNISLLSGVIQLVSNRNTVFVLGEKNNIFVIQG